MAETKELRPQQLWVPRRRLRSRGAEEGSGEAYGAVEAGKEFRVQQGGRAGVQLALPPKEESAESLNHV